MKIDFFSNNMMLRKIRNEKDKCYEWYKNGRLHREDGPAVIYDEGLEYWFYEDKQHRSDGPAVISYYPSGEIEFGEWKIHGVFHRLDGPAFISPWRVEWYKNGKLHRVDGPAIITGGYNTWYYEGKLHRIDGHTTNRNKKWYFHGIKIEKNMIKLHEEFIKFKDKYEKALKLNNLLNLILNEYMILDSQDYYKIAKGNVFIKYKK